MKFASEVEEFLREQHPRMQWSAVAYGSSTTGLCQKDSDVDIFLKMGESTEPVYVSARPCIASACAAHWGCVEHRKRVFILWLSMCPFVCTCW